MFELVRAALDGDLRTMDPVTDRQVALVVRAETVISVTRELASWRQRHVRALQASGRACQNGGPTHTSTLCAGETARPPKHNSTPPPPA